MSKPSRARQAIILMAAKLTHEIIRRALPDTERNRKHMNNLSMVVLAMIGTNVELSDDHSELLVAKLKDTLEYNDRLQPGELNPTHRMNGDDV